MTAAALLLSINFCEVSDLFKSTVLAKTFDPSIIWDYELYQLTGLFYERDIQEPYLRLLERIKVR